MDASLIFERFVQASTFRGIQQTYFQLCCALDIHPCDSTNIYPKVRLLDYGKAYSKAAKLWSLLNKKWEQSEYCHQKACSRLNVLIIGAGPCGLRAAIECALLGAHVVVVEQRDKFSRNNVLHLWNFVIQDLKLLGAKIFFPKFCTGSIEHISIRRLQCILLKVALVLGVQVYENVSFLGLNEPLESNTEFGWRALLQPHNHVLSDYEFDVLIGADGKRNTISGFPRKIVRGKLAIGITANFVNNHTAAEEKVMEISGVAYIFNQSFFNEMLAKTGIDLENIVYYKDDTHYFVMSAKKQSLLKKGVIRQDFEDISTLLSRDNVDQEMLCKYAAQAADFATNGNLPQLTFARNNNLEPDVAMFDFTALYSAVFSTRLVERRAKNLIVAIVGDSLHEPFWPTGSGCARGFLGVFDTAWMLRGFGMSSGGPTEIIAERENVYKLLAQTTKENMCTPCSKYTIDPKTRYKRIGGVVKSDDVCEQVDTDSPRLRPTSKPLPLRISESNNEPARNLSTEFSRSYRLWLLCYRLLLPMKIKVVNFKVQSWGDGKALAALVSKFRPDLIDYAALCASCADGDQMLESAFSAMSSSYAIESPCGADVLEWSGLAEKQRIAYIEKVLREFVSDKALIKANVLSAELGNDVNLRKISTDNKGLKRSLKCSPLHPDSLPRESSAIPKSLSQVAPTKKPAVNKLNPTVVHKLQQMVSGSWEKEQFEKLYDEKNRAANARRAEHSGLRSTEKGAQKIGIASSSDVKCDADETKNCSDESDLQMRTNRASINEEDRGWEKRLSGMKSASLIGDSLTAREQKNGYGKHNFQNYHSSLGTFKVSQNLKDTDIQQAAAIKTNVQTVTRMVPQLDMARKRQRCSICGLEAYLAEQMYLEKMIIHKRCFKCSYCEQPLRLDNCSLDRQLQPSFGLRWFCRQHSHLPLSDKMAKLEKYRRNTDRQNFNFECSRPGNISMGPSVAVVNAVSRRGKESPDKSLNKFDDEIKNSSDDSPTTLVTKAMERIRTRDLDASIIHDANNNHFTDLPIKKPTERVEFGCQREKKAREQGFGMSTELAERECETLINYRQQKMIDALKCLKASSANSKHEFQNVPLYRSSANYDDNWACVGAACSSANQRNADLGSEYNGDSSSSASYDDFENVSSSSTHEDDDNKIDGELWTEFLEMLECTLTSDDLISGTQQSSDYLNEEQMREIIEKFNQTRHNGFVRRPISQTSFGSTTDLFRTPVQQDTSLYFTPRSSRPLNRRSLNDNIRETDDNTKTPVKFRGVSRDAEAKGTSFSRGSRFSNNFQNCRNSQPISPLLKKEFMDGPSRKSEVSSFDGNTSTTENEAIPQRRSRETRLMRSNPRRATVNIDMELSKICSNMAEDQRKSREAEAVYSTTELSEPTSGVLIRKQRRDRLRQKNLDGEVQDLGKMSTYKHRGRSQSSANFSSLLSSFKTNEDRTRLPVTPENVRRAQRYAQTIVARREKEHQLDAYEVQRSLDEAENRVEEVRELGTVLELKLHDEPQNEWLLENWVFYGEELQRLTARQAELTKRAKLIGTAEDYKRLRGELNSLQNRNIGVVGVESEEDLTEDGLEREQRLMEKMLHVLNEQKVIKAELKKSKESPLRPLTVEEVRQILADKQYTFKNFEPLFVKR